VSLSPDQIGQKVARLKRDFADRDARMRDISSVRSGNIEAVAPHLRSQQFPKSVVANFIDVAARDLAESAADLPSFSCSSSNMVSDSAKRKADKRTKIAANYVDFSRLDIKMVSGADHYFSFGLAVVYVEADFEAKMPRMVIEDPCGGYPEYDRWDRCVSYTRTVTKTVDQLVSQFPDHEAAIRGQDMGQFVQGTTKLEVLRYCDKDQVTLILPERKNHVLAYAKNPLGRCPVVVGRRQGLDDQQRGQFDDVIWVQLARGYFASLAIEAADKAVQAPLAVPSDVDEVAFGPDALLKSNSPEKIRRVAQDIPQAAFAEMATLADEQRTGARYPEGRTGNIQASVITGQGVDALMSGFNAQIAVAQRVFKQMLQEAIGLCFELDEKVFGSAKKTIRGQQDGAPYELEYTPGKDIGGDYTVDVQYGMLGMDKNRALVFLLQALGAGLVSKDFVTRQLPFPINVVQEAQQRDVEGLREALLMGISQMPATLPALAAQGGDPAKMIQQLAAIIAGRQKGESLEFVVEKVFAPPAPPPEEEGLSMDPTAPPAPGGPAGPPGMGGPPGGGGAPPDLSTLLAGISASGQPKMSATIKQQNPASF
jgi:hypothetical protein